MTIEESFIPAIYEITSYEHALNEVAKNQLENNTFGLIYTIISNKFEAESVPQND